MDNKTEGEILNEILSDLTARDLKDSKIDEKNREKLEDEGLKLIKPKRTIDVDSGKIEGVENVVDVIVKEIGPSVCIISIEGVSGTGKSATAESLHKRLGTIKFSFGELFRYLTLKTLENHNINYEELFENLNYRIEKPTLFAEIFKNKNYRIDGEKIHLYDGDVNVSEKHLTDLRAKELEEELPHVAAKTQKNVISFAATEIERLRGNLKKIVLLEGRNFTLDFLPSDLRIRLIADPKIRAHRRMIQEFNKS